MAPPRFPSTGARGQRAANVIHWLFSPGVKSYWERAYPWEAARLAIDALGRRFGLRRLPLAQSVGAMG